MKNEYEVRGDVTAIFIKFKGQILETLIDTTDLTKAQEFTGTWYGWKCPKTKGVYVCGQKKINGHRTSFRLHRWITGVGPSLQVDHINHNPLDNRQSVSLRIVNNSQNNQNRKGPLKNNKANCLNVYFDKSRQKWAVAITLNYKKIYFKRFNTKKEAIIAAKIKRPELLPYSGVFI
ncbi:HNH endonuclease [Halalkalibacter krulwichiae]|uniref:HNH nuclease domain-containing protein n=1 Tax=Halalkalibacter krulwichiae TaxID=199441 RepID=A0A1X9MFD8_9BACI|nr:HNH endonuclease [Halalkalibacter krulwichiae]ARK32167.1 hypothetical protein BkAM31D_21240 [Halalkalibacter krulwichiae]